MPHTPGPWTVEIQRAVMNQSRIGSAIVAPTRRVAVVEELPGQPRDADAALIAAAPELLEACLLIDSWLRETASQLGVTTLHEEVMAAIAKAELPIQGA